MISPLLAPDESIPMKAEAQLVTAAREPLPGLLMAPEPRKVAS